MKPRTLHFDHDRFYLDDEPFFLCAGDVHYFRIPVADWDSRLDLCVDFGLNTIQTYVPWNAHEPQPGHFCFDGMLDLPLFLEKCAAHGLRVLLRPAPYICSEWDLGGLPAWLLRDEKTELRSSDPTYLQAVARYYDALIPRFLPYLSTKGGPILAVALENEYGSFGQDHAYIHALGRMLREGGVDVPFYTAEGDLPSMIAFGRRDAGDLVGTDYRANRGTSAHAEAIMRQELPHNPFFCAEFWAGRSIHWGEPFHFRDPRETSDGYAEGLALGGHISFYMFSGGTNFGFMGGANYGRSYSARPGTPERYIPHATTYDEDALIHADGTVGDKYFLCRDALDRHLGRPARPHIAPAHPTQALTVPLDRQALLFDNLEALTGRLIDAPAPRPMEEYGQNYGLILYTQTVEAYTDDGAPGAVWPYRMKDRATIFANGAYLATYMRDRGVRTDGAATCGTGADARVLYQAFGKETRFDTLVENLGRVNFGHQIQEEHKGMYGLMYRGGCKVYGCRTRTLPLDDLSGLTYTARQALRPHMPVFYAGTFSARPGIDTYVDMRAFGHGYVWVNGFNLGRYDEAGPQYTLYLPGSLLTEHGNEIVVLDLAPRQECPTLPLLDHMILEGEGKELS